MKFGVGLGLGAVALVGTIAFFAFTVSQYARETSGIEERWGTHTIAERERELGTLLSQIAGTAPCAPIDGAQGPDDTDGDGLTNADEKEAGTDATKIDTDSDGFCDAVELFAKSNPTDPNSQPAFDTNISTSTTNPPLGGSRDNPNDHDNDGLANDVETGTGVYVDPKDTGTDPTNPDSDGDGTVDGKDPSPNDADDGGIQPPPPDTRPPHIPQLVLNNFTKTVRGPLSGDQWTHATEARLGDALNFHLHGEATNEGGYHRLVIEDRLPRGLSLVSKSATISTNGGTPVPVSDAGFPRQVMIVKTPPNSRFVVDIYFSAKATAIGGLSNEASMFVENESGKLTDTAYAIIHSLDAGDTIGGGFGQICTLCSLTKEGRVAGTAAWSQKLKANANDIIEFRIAAEASLDIDGSPVSLKLTDTLPAELVYTKGSGKLFKNGIEQTIPNGDSWITTGLSLLADAPKTTFEIKFSAKVKTVAPFALTNTAKADASSKKPSSRIAAVTITSKP